MSSLAVIGGSGFEQFFLTTRQVLVETPYGFVSTISIGTAGDREIIFLSRHGVKHSIPPHKINYRANIWALHKLGVERIISLNAVGAINPAFKPCDVVVPHDFVDFTKTRSATFYDDAPVTHIDMSVPFCPETRSVILGQLKLSGLHFWEKAVLLCVEGPRFETPAEIEAFRRLGCDIVGMTGITEAVLARELEMCYVPICFVSNMAAGLQLSLSPMDATKNSKLVTPQLGQALIDAMADLPMARSCSCSNAIKNARFS
jgi:5'-methylthioadenosine phosphorylase